MTIPLTVAPAIRFHLSLNVTDLCRSIAFYRTLFNREPAKMRSDYAKFEMDDPPLVLSLEPSGRTSGGPLNHLGFRMGDMASLVALQERLEISGIRSQREAGVECCYAKQTKFWVSDPDGVMWEFYLLEGDIEHRGADQSPDVLPLASNEGGEWVHRLGDPIADVLPLEDRSVREVRLFGTFNQQLPSSGHERLVQEIARIMRPGGRIFVHALVGEQEVQRPDLPGPAAAVQVVPIQSEPKRLLQSAGFGKINYLKFDDKPRFVHDGVAMREMQIEAWKNA